MQQLEKDSIAVDSIAADSLRIRQAMPADSLGKGSQPKDTVITKLVPAKKVTQRMLILDIILEGDFSCCKEIYYRAMEQDSKIGTATVYRMINTLEEIGVISRKNMYKVAVS